MMLENVSKALTNIGLASVGLAAMAAEQAGKAGKILAEKGAVVLEEGRKQGEKLQEQYRQDAQRRREERFDDQVCRLDAVQREALRRRLAELDELEREAKEAAREEDGPSEP